MALTEAVAAVAALSTCTGRRKSRFSMRRPMDCVADTVDVATRFDEVVIVRLLRFRLPKLGR